MGGVLTSLFGAPKVAKATKPPPPPPVPDVGEEPGIIARRRRPRGRRETFLTGDLIPETGKKRVLG